jgi:hypothetical protein
MKNFMKKNMRRAIDSWPSRKPCVKERLHHVLVGQLIARVMKRPYDEPWEAGCWEGAWCWAII